MAGPADVALFEAVAAACRGLIPPELGEFGTRFHAYGLKLWFGTAQPGREHYEAQVIGARHVPDAQYLAIEIGFHSEHPKVAANDEVIARLIADERRWRKVLGDDAEVAPFLGREDLWRRVSETWVDPDLSDEDLAVEVALRLTDYATALEPTLRG